ncbi:MAG TPA: redoxin domain-containing protein [Burkholderiales bacterium]|nr:redoxin domain-containing protein [Burkholderiales bacterium]
MVAQRLSNLVVLSCLLIGMLVKPSVGIALEVGEQAPDFALPSTTGEQISLSQFRGKKLVLLEFYGVDFAPTCVANLSARKADYHKFQELNIQILGISTNHPFSQKTLAESLQLPYPLLSDFPELQVTRQYGGLSRNPTLVKHGIAERAFFLIDTQGTVRQKWIVTGGEDIVFPSEALLKGAREIAAK